MADTELAFDFKFEICPPSFTTGLPQQSGGIVSRECGKNMFQVPLIPEVTYGIVLRLTLGLVKKLKCLNCTSIFITFLTKEAHYSRIRGDKKKRLLTDLDLAQKIPIGTVIFSDGIDFGTSEKI